MDNMNDMLSSVLGDPESLQQLKELADMLRSEMGNSSSPETEQGTGFDPAMLMSLMSAVTAAGQDDKNRTLLLALRPFLSPERRQKLDKAVQLLKIYAVYTELKKSGAIDDLSKLI